MWRFKRFSTQNTSQENLRILDIKISEATYDLRDSANVLGLWPTMKSPYRHIMSSLAVLPMFLILLGAFFILKPDRKLYVLFLVYGLLHAAYYFIEAKMNSRYLMPTHIAVILGLGILAGRWVQNRRQKILCLGVFAILFFNSLSSGFNSLRFQHGAGGVNALHLDLLQAARWIEAGTPEDAIVGSWNAGILSYFSKRTVVNLDGVVNSRAIEINKSRRLNEYLKERKINYIADVDSEIEKFFRLFAEDKSELKRFREVASKGRVKVLRKDNG